MKRFNLKKEDVKISPYNNFMNILNDKVNYKNLHLFEVKIENRIYTIEHLVDYKGYTNSKGYNYKLLIMDMETI